MGGNDKAVQLYDYGTDKWCWPPLKGIPSVSTTSPSASTMGNRPLCFLQAQTRSPGCGHMTLHLVNISRVQRSALMKATSRALACIRQDVLAPRIIGQVYTSVPFCCIQRSIHRTWHTPRGGIISTWHANVKDPDL
ncbi:hypothetical protein SCLCIDRAFT_767813 [Scleroderma citrinum Foug A]|uniref:Uncharacterized protein n=1 Tax=Scleroderma citrinum Foug A TaxID=1036808 RepID=A0A0C3E536_9AGAM|nr:hypothetical protein SCLCIDRAFT_767813 [Scleroderma citrinum Foug A]